MTNRQRIIPRLVTLPPALWILLAAFTFALVFETVILWFWFSFTVIVPFNAKKKQTSNDTELAGKYSADFSAKEIFQDWIDKKLK